MDHLPMHTLRRCFQRYKGDQYVKNFTCQDQYRCMTFAQLAYRESLRDIEACLSTIPQILSLTSFERIPLNQLLTDIDTELDNMKSCNLRNCQLEQPINNLRILRGER